MRILGELDRLGLIHTDRPTVHTSKTYGEALEKWDIMRSPSAEVEEFFRAAPGGVRTIEAFSSNNMWKDLDRDQKAGCIRSGENAYSQDGGLAVLYGNIAEDGCIVKTAGVPEECLDFTGVARIFESQDSAVKGILGKQIKEGDIVVIRYEGPRGGPGMQEMLYPTSYLKAIGTRQEMRPDHRWPLLRWFLRPECRTHIARSGSRRSYRSHRRRRPHSHQHHRTAHSSGCRGGGFGCPPRRHGSKRRGCLATNRSARAQSHRRP